MRYAVALLALLVASPTLANEAVLILAWSRAANPIPETALDPGNTVRFAIHSEGSDSFVFDHLIPAVDCCSEQIHFTEANAAAAGINWADLEAIVSGSAAKSVDFGPLGHEGHVPYLREFPGEYLTNVSLDEMYFNYYGGSRWNSVYVSVRGAFTIIAPEPSAATLFALCFGLAHVTLRSRYCRSS